jgi:hypothetical protein
VLVKPYLEGLDDLGATRGDKSRIIGIAELRANKYERVDIKIQRMSH